jgi:4-amino-4-deoxy-L-arabinose transferase-like glycosyltransferase
MERAAGRYGWSLVVGAAALATILRFSGIDAKSLWGDEIVSLTVSMGHSWYPWQGEETELVYSASHYRELVSLSPTYFSERLGALLRMNDQVPPLYYILLNLWLHAFGTSEAALRSLSLLASVATIPVLYLLASALASQRVGVYAAWVFALAPFQVAFALYNRPYAWLGFFAVLSSLAAVHLSRGERGNWLILYAVTITLGLYTHYLFVWNVAFQIVLVGFYRRHDRPFLIRFALACLCVAIACLFWAPTFVAQVQWSRELRHQSWFYWYSGMPPVFSVVASLARNAFLLLSAGRLSEFCAPGGDRCEIDGALRLVIYAVPLLMVGLGGWRLLQDVLRKAAQNGLPNPWGTCLLWCGCVFLGPAITDFLLDSHIVYSHRYFIGGGGPLYIAVAMVVVGTTGRALRWSIGAGFLLFLFAGSVLYHRGLAPALMYEMAARDVARHIDGRSADADDLVLLMDPGLNPMDFAYYLRSNPDIARVKVPERHLSAPDIPAQLRAVTAARRRARIWYLDDHGPERDPHNAVLGWLSTHYDEVERREFTNVSAFVFSPRSADDVSASHSHDARSGRD